MKVIFLGFKHFHHLDFGLPFLFLSVVSASVEHALPGLLEELPLFGSAELGMKLGVLLLDAFHWQSNIINVILLAVLVNLEVRYDHFNSEDQRV